MCAEAFLSPCFDSKRTRKNPPGPLQSGRVARLERPDARATYILPSGRACVLDQRSHGVGQTERQPHHEYGSRADQQRTRQGHAFCSALTACHAAQWPQKLA